MDYICSKLNPKKIGEVVSLSKKWENEAITHGLVAGSADSFKQLLIWTCTYNDCVIAYLSGSKRFSENMCVFPPNTDYFEIDELYVRPEWRSKGIGTKLFHYVEQEVKKQNIEYLLLSSATKDYQKVLDFYTRMGMDVWTLMFYKKL